VLIFQLEGTDKLRETLRTILK